MKGVERGDERGEREQRSEKERRELKVGRGERGERGGKGPVTHLLIYMFIRYWAACVNFSLCSAGIQSLLQPHSFLHNNTRTQ